MRAQMRRESQQRRMREKSASKGLTANYLESEIFEDDEQELEESLAAIKSKYKKDMKGVCPYTHHVSLLYLVIFIARTPFSVLLHFIGFCISGLVVNKIMCVW